MSKNLVQYVTGYECPNCGSESIGVEIRHRREDRVDGWAQQLPLADVPRILCFNCEFEVPRDKWYINDQLEPR